MLSAAAKRVLPLTAEDVYAHGLRIIHYDWLTSENERLPQGAAGSVETHGSNGWAIAPSKSGVRQRDAVEQLASAVGRQGHLLRSAADGAGRDVVRRGVGRASPFCASASPSSWRGRRRPTARPAPTSTGSRSTDDGYVLDGKTQSVRGRAADHQSAAGGRDAARRAAHDPPVGARAGVLAIAAASPWRCASSPADRPRMFEQFWRMGLAKNFEEWRTAMRMQQLPIFHTMYADRDGHIMYVYNAAPPVRAHGDHAFWNGVIPGDRSDAHCRRRDRAVRSAAAGRSIRRAAGCRTATIRRGPRPTRW